MSVLEELVAAAKERARDLPRGEPASFARAIPFDQALRGKAGLSVIAEFKKASPTEGRICERDAVHQVKRYARAGAAAVSVLTEPTLFRGSYEDLKRAAATLEIPVLMKDFIVDPAQIRLAASLGAGAYLLIVRCLDSRELEELAAAGEEYGLVPLVECHHQKELSRALRIEQAVIGINNRNLDTLEVDRGLAPRLLREIPADRIVVAESGYDRPEDVEELRGIADAVLIGTALMRQADPRAFIEEITR